MGGIRLPELVAPTAIQLDTNPGNPVAALAGQSTRLPKEQLAGRYPDRERYLKAWDAAVEYIVSQGLVLASDVVGRRWRTGDRRRAWGPADS